MTKREEIKLIYRKKSRYHNIDVIDKGEHRFLLTGEGRAKKQSCINVNNLREHVLNYSSLMFSSLLFTPQPERILIVGLGGGVIPREMAFYLPNTTIDTIEIDYEIADIAKRFFFFEQNQKSRVIIGDGRDVISRMQIEVVKPYDIIILDAFHGEYVPKRLMTVEFLKKTQSILSDSGVVAANIFNTHALYKSQVITFEEVFGKRLYCLRGKRAQSTTIVFAPGDKASTFVSERDSAKTAARLELKFELQTPRRMLTEEYRTPGHEALRDDETIY